MTIGNHTLPTEILRTCSDGMFYCFSDWAFDVTNGIYWTLMLLGFSVALIWATSKAGMARAFGFGSFAGMIGSIWFATMSLIPWWTATVFIIVGLIGIGLMFISDR